MTCDPPVDTLVVSSNPSLENMIGIGLRCHMGLQHPKSRVLAHIPMSQLIHVTFLYHEIMAFEPRGPYFNGTFHCVGLMKRSGPPHRHQNEQIQYDTIRVSLGMFDRIFPRKRINESISIYIYLQCLHIYIIIYIMQCILIIIIVIIIVIYIYKYAVHALYIKV